MVSFEKNQKIVMLTVYDYSFAKIIDSLNVVDMLLVGDSMGMVIQGHNSTIPVTLDQIIYHTQAVLRGVKNTLVISDMPFMSFQVSTEETIRNACRIIQEGGANAVKLEGAGRNLGSIKRLIEVGIPVQGHLGLTPQSFNKLGWKVQAKTKNDVDKLISDAKLLEEAGIFSLVLEAIPVEAAKLVTESISIPTIGIGAGPHCDGQVLVLHDMLGFNENPFVFVKKFGNIKGEIEKAVTDYSNAIKSEKFPGFQFSYKSKIID